MKTLLLTLILLLPLSSIADTPCHVAITSYEKQIDSLETRLATAQSVPYNQGYQEGYRVAKLEQTEFTISGKKLIIVFVVMIIGFIIGRFLANLCD
jgi:hypothetical protein